MGVPMSAESLEAEAREMMIMTATTTTTSLVDLEAVDYSGRKGSMGGLVMFPLGGGGRGGASGGDRCLPVGEAETVCVTSGVSFLGLAVANRLLARGYSVRLLLDTQEELEKAREMGIIFGSATGSSSPGGGHEVDDGDFSVRDDCDGRRRAAVVVGDMADVERLCEAFHGCGCVFHTSAFSDPSGLSGYSKHMAEAEARTAERVIEACVRTESVKKCVFTSSLLACVWRQIIGANNSAHSNRRFPIVVDENCWSDETLCRDKKLWYALGKTMAEKAAWRAARGRDLKLVTVCPGLVTGPGFRRRSSTASIAYLKGSREMLREGLLATVDVGKLAEAQVSVYEAMGRTACGRYICFDHVIRRIEDVAELERQLGIGNRESPPSAAVASSDDQPTWSELSKRKLTSLMAASRRRCSSRGFLYSSLFY